MTYLPDDVYVYCGETEMIKESAQALLAYLKYLTTRTDENGTIHIGLGDWCHVGPIGTRCKSPLEVTDSIISMDIAEKMAVMFDAVGLTEERDFAKKVATDYRAAIRKNLIDFDTMLAKGNCQTSQAMCIYYTMYLLPKKVKLLWNACLK